MTAIRNMQCDPRGSTIAFHPQRTTVDAPQPCEPASQRSKTSSQMNCATRMHSEREVTFASAADLSSDGALISFSSKQV